MRHRRVPIADCRSLSWRWSTGACASTAYPFGASVPLSLLAPSSQTGMGTNQYQLGPSHKPWRSCRDVGPFIFLHKKNKYSFFTLWDGCFLECRSLLVVPTLTGCACSTYVPTWLPDCLLTLVLLGVVPVAFKSPFLPCEQLAVANNKTKNGPQTRSGQAVSP